jgi:hypothetical protein
MEGDKGGRGLRPGLNPIIHLIGLERGSKMSDTIPLVCASCGATAMRHPTMRLRGVVCLDCVQKAKSELKRARWEKRRLVEQRVVLDPPR